MLKKMGATTGTYWDYNQVLQASPGGSRYGALLGIRLWVQKGPAEAFQAPWEGHPT
jgi:hypothetical protein